jgi:hypothetical protein
MDGISVDLILSFYNLWIFYVIGYAIAYSMQTWANKKRGEPFDDPEFLFHGKHGKSVFVVAMIWGRIIGGFAISFLTQVNFGSLS